MTFAITATPNDIGKKASVLIQWETFTFLFRGARGGRAVK